MAYDDEEYEVPLQDQRVFGGGLKRKRIQFVPSSSSKNIASHKPVASTSGTKSASEAYMKIVFGPDRQDHKGIQLGSTSITDSDDTQLAVATTSVCTICRLPVDNDGHYHESKLTHQLCLEHIHPPSNIDRQRRGLAILQSQGWDADGRVGLGSTGEGRLYPVAAIEKLDRSGIGHDTSDVQRGARRKSMKRAKRLDAGKIRKLEKQDRIKDRQMKDAFYLDTDVERYLQET